MRLQGFARRLFQRLSWLAKPAGDHRVRRDALRRVCHLCVRQGCRLRRHARRLRTRRRTAHRIRCECHGRKAIRGAQRVAGLAEQGVHILRAHVLFAPGDARRASACDPGAGRPRRLSSTQRHIHLSPAATEDAIRLLDGRGCGVGLAGGEPWRHFGYAGGGEVKQWGPSSR